MADSSSSTGLLRLLGLAALPLLVPFACSLQSYGTLDGGVRPTSSASASGGEGGMAGSGGAGGMGGSGAADGGGPKCGDGHIDEGEDCDDGNLIPGDGCTGCLNCNDPGDFLDPTSWHCYTHVTGASKNWSDARKDCQARGGDLAAISSLAEHDSLNAKTSTDVWIGGNDQVEECVFTWTNGEPWYPRWNDGQPNNYGDAEDCVILHSGGQFNDNGCNLTHDYLCERVLQGSCGDAIVQPGEECDDGNGASGDGCAQCQVECAADEIKFPANRHCYRFVTGADKTWEEAKNACSSAGGYLAAVTTPEEAAFLEMHKQGNMWLGMQWNAGWVWLTNEPNCWVKWGSGQPSFEWWENCVESRVDGTWNNVVCTTVQAYVCERSPLGD